ncbi:MAG: phenylphosphate carboxylase subunit delta [Candidatus Dactylopiibacterium carminicum]|uniref:3-deoxy-D-manno-octulosonate 8-phosphate phosphatase KdsC n=1 Tax=Candidatus Dactylopiibacterium carminicum TaxID=857335 RepID=A0A272ERJ0_9RHOO|nr:HAD family hydrolase [Candidatus Dactylopiibacterium carminicum]KAF7598821.1 phenylphosphate carboxylase subunit delta [Candidatus Dactylopiibacterium carminicum]PAS92723.1 MAG: phenylphosphate carboxylase subunit delta [Candidatus Dactylopiibacterium carminicum]PAS96171.1 MAG: phenylphosphate carboxylase subunit delta [Candidatus Dactylopiibacterium carminicum]PAS98842.1 MAG: phenylphosphate carboxylase subunit delta [Candidatus Dactylopiibacterium carminicum]
MSRPAELAAQVRLMGFDVDGVLTNGDLYFTPAGDEIKVFSSLDGHGLKMLMEAGVEVAIITGRDSQMVAHRARNLGIRHLFQGVHDKRAVMRELRASLGLTAEQTGYIGDDVVDLPILRACGFSATVADGHDFVKSHVDYVTRKGGGRGAVRELSDFILAAQGKLDALHQGYLNR